VLKKNKKKIAFPHCQTKDAPDLRVCDCSLGYKVPQSVRPNLQTHKHTNTQYQMKNNSLLVSLCSTQSGDQKIDAPGASFAANAKIDAPGASFAANAKLDAPGTSFAADRKLDAPGGRFVLA
jgi:hypothetical protein